MGHLADEASDDGGDSEWVKFCRVSGVFVAAKQVYIGKITFNGGWKPVLVD